MGRLGPTRYLNEGPTKQLIKATNLVENFIMFEKFDAVSVVNLHEVRQICFKVLVRDKSLLELYCDLGFNLSVTKLTALKTCVTSQAKRSCIFIIRDSSG